MHPVRVEVTCTANRLRNHITWGVQTKDDKVKKRKNKRTINKNIRKRNKEKKVNQRERISKRKKRRLTSVGRPKNKRGGTNERTEERRAFKNVSYFKAPTWFGWPSKMFYWKNGQFFLRGKMIEWTNCLAVTSNDRYLKKTIDTSIDFIWHK